MVTLSRRGFLRSSSLELAAAHGALQPVGVDLVRDVRVPLPTEDPKAETARLAV
ncbi:hypothetical protein M2163_001380 [Streptomyces sp. SAI-135]|uniref:hypothetical protein n=1 Tax=unclassified Streptomyces TaxID=2593676 RepID=UPI0024766198|nr:MULTISPECIES: hypothetical protein [unclassified Streptomyces]MDH6521629.1 hypothetical protein [Streptomyces sp. SAI-090]MDH6614272.1 hypothetical protein [Streptomyces sp. SAI-135]